MNRPLTPTGTSPGIAATSLTGLRLVLGSTSAYRRQLLERLGIPFTVAASNVDEERLPSADEVGVRPRPRHEPRVQAEHAPDEGRQPRGLGERRRRPRVAHAGRTTVDQSKR